MLHGGAQKFIVSPMKRINVRITAEDRQVLDAEAERLGVSVSDVVRVVIRTYLPEFARRASILGNTKPDDTAPRPA